MAVEMRDDDDDVQQRKAMIWRVPGNLVIKCRAGAIRLIVCCGICATDGERAL
jgi:hypothetical protein